MINIFLIIIIIALVYYIFKLKTQKEIKVELFRVLNENKDYDKIDELFGSPWYSTLVKEVDNIILKSQKS
jgi:hypothetical protein